MGSKMPRRVAEDAVLLAVDVFVPRLVLWAWTALASVAGFVTIALLMRCFNAP